jgi:hypothetical protein
MEELRNSQKQNKKIDFGTVKKTRILLKEATEGKEQLSQEQKNWLESMGKELAEFENLDDNPYNLPDAVTDIMKTVGRK